METINHDPKCRCAICIAKRYQPGAPGSDLTKKQKRAAVTLLTKRPMCLPGTRTIIRAGEAQGWHDLVTKAAIELKLNPQQVAAFCDAAGVAT